MSGYQIDCKRSKTRFHLEFVFHFNKKDFYGGILSKF